ncbi:hypothetical protein HN51_020379 [Arachis hypogaea]|uniref:Uncharacterized protein n=1 Tax=Arachis hypogaea TaxID=3818 RepID=A0A445C0R1_ARAHY|nr:uncharacterized protein LOC112707850 [Arachis hypogaea]XP_057727796.1 protein CHLOROPLAST VESICULATION [Arachis stenosperma]QHO32323.1 uncharacterized protein DS421_8g248800 [Arachis hypogaea]RYR44502.1 hypothetical protein Ahy_A08g040832 [Arachis hypogaea]
MRTSCFLNLPIPTSNQAPNASLIPIKPPQVSLVKIEGNWKRHVMVGVTIIGLELIINNSSLGHEKAFAEEIMKSSSVTSNNSSLVSSLGSGSKWSEKRACPPWHGSSLETIVPENLPRPAARRRYEAVGSQSKTAPPLLVDKTKLRSNNKESCFSM